MSNATKALLLTTYFKWLNLFPEIREQLVAVFDKSSRLLDAELQQRACEYLAIANLPDEELLQVVVDEMPPFPERESAVSRAFPFFFPRHEEGTNADPTHFLLSC